MSGLTSISSGVISFLVLELLWPLFRGSYEELLGRVENAGSFRISDVSERISVIEAKNSSGGFFEA